MQKLQEKLKNAPVDASQVRRSASTALNRAERLSAPRKVLSCNNPEGNPLRHAGGRSSRVAASVHVLNMRGQPLMPTTPRNARRLLREGRAEVAKRLPFVIRLKSASGETKQKTALGIDSGYGRIGFSCVSEKRELIGGVLQMENKTRARMDERRMYRRNRRNRLWYRKPRFDNRRKGESWLPPSVERSYRAHVLLVEKIKKMLPVSEIRIEVGSFDIQKLEKPAISGTEYQQGDRYGYENTKAFLMAREKGLCQLCGKTVRGGKINLHHIVSRSKGGTNRTDNIALLHEKCHERLHKKGMVAKLKANAQFKGSTFMSVIRWRLRKDLDCELTYGYKTFCDRTAIGLEKSHANDAFVIAGGTRQKRCTPLLVVQKRKNNRALQLNRKGYAPAIRKKRHSIQPRDLVGAKGKIFEAVGVHNKGKSVIVVSNRKKLDITMGKITSVFHFNSLIFKQEKTAIPPRSQDRGSIAA